MSSQRPIAIYSSDGETRAYLAYPYLYNLQGEWLGWVTPAREVFSVLGVYVGYLSNDPRILRKRNLGTEKPRRVPPPRPPALYPPVSTPLAPLMPEISYDMIDVLVDYPEDLHTLDHGDLVEDMD